jgi:trehalose 6-phosphate phosphatase
LQTNRERFTLTLYSMHGALALSLGGQVKDVLVEKLPAAEERGCRLKAPPDLDVDRHAVLLDVDGTLLAIEPRPEAVMADAVLRDLLRRAESRMNGAIALVTGRTVRDADRIFGGAVATVAGLHGMECRLAPSVWLRRAPSTGDMRQVLSVVQELVQRGAFDAHIEEKGAAIALHYRHAPFGEIAVRRAVHAVAQAHGLKVLQGKMVVELLAEETTKGHAVAELMGCTPFRERTPIAIGDDVTDEDAFSAAARLGGAGVLVGEARGTAAKFCLPDVAAVRRWLARGLAGHQS